MYLKVIIIFKKLPPEKKKERKKAPGFLCILHYPCYPHLLVRNVTALCGKVLIFIIFSNCFEGVLVPGIGYLNLITSKQETWR